MSFSVLVVDDDLELRELLQQMLTFRGFTVFEAVNGVDALEKLKQCQPDVIVLDVMMPVMDGITFCKTLRQQATTPYIPVVMLSGKTQVNAMAEGLAAGADRYLAKPISLKRLVGTLQELLPVSDGRLSPPTSYDPIQPLEIE